MDAQDASSAEMRQPPSTDPLALDDASVDRLLSGTLSPASAPPGYARVARLLAATVAPPTPRELTGQAAILAELQAVTRARRPTTTVRPARPRRRRAGMAVVVVAGALATGGVAAATGHLPGPVREAARSVLTPAGGAAATTPSAAPLAPPVTGPAGSAGTGPGGSRSAVGPGRGPGPTVAGPAAGPALEGLCQAFLEGKSGEQGKKPDATAFKELARVAGGAAEVPAFCQELVGADKAKDPKDAKPKDPPDDGDQGQGGPPPTTGGSANGGSGQGQSNPAPGPSPPPDR